MLTLECPFQAINLVIRSVGLECDEQISNNFRGCQDAQASPMTPRDMQCKINDWKGQVGTNLLLGYQYAFLYYNKATLIQQVDLIFHEMDYQ